MQLAEILTILDEIDFWEGLVSEREAFVGRYDEHVREYGDDDAILTLATVEYDTEMIDGTGPAKPGELDLFSYHTLIEHYARGSGGHFQPTGIVDRFDESTQQHTVGFTLGQASYEVTFEAQDDWVNERVHELINRALNESGNPRQFQPLPVMDQVIYACFTTPEKLQIATKRGVIPLPDEIF